MTLFLLACTNHVDRARWQSMSPSAQRVYVSSLLGGEKAKSAKGGSAHTYSASADDYVRRINQAYSAGDQRDPAVIFASLADKR